MCSELKKTVQSLLKSDTEMILMISTEINSPSNGTGKRRSDQLTRNINSVTIKSIVYC